MAEKQCSNGHVIDASWDLCPFCPVDEPPPFSVVKPRTLDAPLVPRPAPAPPIQSKPERIPSPPPPPPPPQEQPIAPGHTAVIARASTPRYVVGWLIGLDGKSRGESFPIRIGKNVIGRDRRVEVNVDDEQVSAHHADLVFRPDERRYILMDANSTNGTYVNGEEIQPRSDLKAEDIIKLGSQRFLFVPLCRDGMYWEDEGLLK